MAAQPESVSSNYGPRDSPYRLKFLEGQESIASYCARITDRCHQWSYVNGGPIFRNPLMICDVIIGGLPDAFPWKELKENYSDLVIAKDGQGMPNKDVYMLNEKYLVTPEYLQGKLKVFEQIFQMMKEGPNNEPEEDPIEEDMPEREIYVPTLTAHTGFRPPIPNPDDLTGAYHPHGVIYHPGLETLKDYCAYIENLCITWNKRYRGSFASPLSICHYILNGLPRVTPWKEIKDDFSDLITYNAWGEEVPNTSKYIHHMYGDYLIDPHTLLGRLERIATIDAEAKREAGHVLRKLERMDKKEIAKKVQKAWGTIEEDGEDDMDPSDSDYPYSPQYTPLTPSPSTNH